MEEKMIEWNWLVPHVISQEHHIQVKGLGVFGALYWRCQDWGWGFAVGFWGRGIEVEFSPQPSFWIIRNEYPEDW